VSKIVTLVAISANLRYFSPAQLC